MEKGLEVEYLLPQTLHTSYLAFKPTQLGWHYCYPHLADEETEAQRHS